MYKIFATFLILLICSLKVSYAEEKIAFINIDMIINQSDVGKKSYKKTS